MPLLLLDLDNTLVDRAAAFLGWAGEFVALHATGPVADDVEWLIAADADGYEARDRLALRIAERFHLGEQARKGIEEDLRWGMADRLAPDPEISKALTSGHAPAQVLFD